MSPNDIPIGRDAAINRKDLARIWHCDERDVRAFVALLRTQGGAEPFFIVSSSSGCPGYWRSNVPAEIRAYIRETTNRGRNTFAPLKEARRVLARLEGGA